MDNNEPFYFPSSEQMVDNRIPDLTFDDFFDLDERDDPVICHQPQKQTNSSEMQNINLNNDSVINNLDFDPEMSLQTPTKIFTSSRTSTSPRILGAHNPGVQKPQSAEEDGSFNTSFGSENRHPYQMESIPNDSCELRQDKNPGENKLGFCSGASNRTPTKFSTSKRKSTSPQILGGQSSAFRRPQNVEYEIGNSQRKDDNILRYDPSEMSNTQRFPRKDLQTYPTCRYPMYNFRKERQKAPGTSRQLRLEFQNVNSHFQENNKPFQDNNQLVYGQTLPPINTFNIRNPFPNPFLQTGMYQYGYMVNNPHMNYPRFENRYASYGPHPNMTNLVTTTNLTNYPENPQMLPSTFEQTVDLSYATKDKITGNKDDLLEQNKHQLTDTVCKTEMQNIKSDPSPQTHFLDNFMQSASHKHPGSSVYQENRARHTSKGVQPNPVEKYPQQKYSEKSIQQRNSVESAQKTEDQIIQKKTLKQTERKKTQDQNAQKKNVDKNPQKKNADGNAHKKNVDQIAQKTNSDQIVHKKNVDQIGQKTNDDHIVQNKNEYQIGQKKDLDHISQKRNLDLISKNAVENVQQKNSGDSPQKQGMDLDNVRRNVVDQTVKKTLYQIEDKKGLEQAGQKKALEKTEQKTLEETGQRKILEETGQRKTLEETGQKKILEQTGSKKTLEQTVPKKTLEQTKQKTLEQTEQKKTLEQTGQKKTLEETVPKKTLEETVPKKTLEETGLKKTLEETGRKKTLEETGRKKTLEETGQKKTLDQIAQKKTLDLISENPDENVQLKNSNDSAPKQDMDLDNVRRNVQQNAESVTQQETESVFTGKGYDSIEDFIKALYDGTLYKPR